MISITQLFKPAPYQEEIEDPTVVKEKYDYWRMRVFYSMFFGYMFYYFTRKSFTFAMPDLIRDLGFDKGHLGILSSILSITYGLSKFISGIVGDRSNARYFMAFGLVLTGVFNILFGFSSSIIFFSLFWGLNGWFQGFGWPACARLLTHWYSQNERGRWWAFWNTSHNVGGALIPLIAAFFAQYWGWRCAMIMTGSFCILGGFFLMNRLCDTPQSLGLPTIEKFRNDYPTKNFQEKERELSAREILFEHVLSNPYIWILAASYFFVYIIRTAVNDWTILFLVESKGYSQLVAGSIIFWFEMGGVLGSLTAGWTSDTIFQGRRGPISALFSFLVSGVVILFWLNTTQNVFLDSILTFGIGFFIFGPQMLIGMAAAELSHKKAAATASGFTGCVSYLGAATAGYPLGMITEAYGWEGFFVSLICCGILSTLLLLPLWKIKARDSKSSRLSLENGATDSTPIAEKGSRLKSIAT